MADTDKSIFKLFGFELKKATKSDTDLQKLPSIVPPTDDDGAGYVSASGSHYGQYLNMDGDGSKDNHQLILRYRGVAMQPEVDMAIEEIVNEAICHSADEQNVDITLDKVEAPDNIKKQIKEEFDNIVSMLDFNNLGHDIFRSWYVDGRLYHHLLVNEANLKAGIQEIRHIDSSKIRKIKKVQKKDDPKTGAPIVTSVEEFYIFEEKPGQSSTGVRLSPDAINYITSGLLDERKQKVLSYLHKALKPINQLRMMEDSLVIYRLARAPERRIFYIDVGNMPRGKAEQYMKDIMTRYRNKLVYDASTGDLKDERKHMSMLEDFWLPRREGGRGTEISTLPGGDNLGQIDDIIYFQKRLYRALNVPVNRLEQEAQFSLGRTTEITRDEVKFQKFIDRLRQRFSKVFLDVLEKQLILKGIITKEDWETWKTDIIVDFVRDNHFTELKDMEILRERLQTLNEAQPYIGDFFSKEYVSKTILMMSDEDIVEMKKQIEEEEKSGDLPDPDAEEEAPANTPPAPTPVTVVEPEEAPKEPKKKEEKYIPSHDDELTEELTRYMARLNEQD
jgi:hypothetical protein|tara:strand:- start:9474 stop:11156 length:1683 start_codon:yes stop_codon:yes gene_type:complete